MADGDLTVHQAIVEIINEMGGIGKDDHNDEQNYNFRGIDATLQVLHPLFAKYGIFFAPDVIERHYEEGPTAKSGTKSHRAMLRVKYTVYGPTGDSIVLSTWGEGLDYSDKAHNKAMTAAFKYALFQVFAICDPVEDSDRGSDEPQGQSEELSPFAQLIDTLVNSGFLLPVQFDIVKTAIGRSITDINQLNDEEIVKAMLAVESAIADRDQLESEKE